MNDIFSLPAPGPAKPQVLRIVPLGGLGEVGRNMTVLETQGKILIVDCGVLFPEEIQPGVDLILPDFSYIQDRLDDVVGMVLTHGHEDHIGAVPYLLKQREDIPLYGSQLTLAFVEPKLNEHRIPATNLHVHAEGDRVRLGPFDLEFCAVNHSIPDALAVFVRTKISCLWTGASRICVPLRAGAKKASIYSWWIPRTPKFRDSSLPNAKSGRCWKTSLCTPRDRSWWPVSLRMCTASNRC